MLHIEQTLLTKGIKYIQNSLPGSFGSNSNDIHRTKSQEPIDDSSNRSMPPADIGIEREPAYFDIACRRIEQAYKQGQLFEHEPIKQIQGDLL